MLGSQLQGIGSKQLLSNLFSEHYINSSRDVIWRSFRVLIQRNREIGVGVEKVLVLFQNRIE